MTLRQVGAVLLALLTACGGGPGVRGASVQEDGEAVGHELRVVSARVVRAEPVDVDAEAFREAVARLAREARREARPQEAARRLFPSEREVEFLAQVEDGRIVRMTPLGEVHPPSRAEAALTREYLRWCERTQGGGDCLRLLVDGPVLRGDDRYALALALALGSVLEETRLALKGVVEPSAVLALLVWSAVVYLLLWTVPEPFSKGLAAALTVGLLAWLGAETVWGLLSGWGRLVQEANRATTFEEMEAAGARYGRVLGQNTARVLVMLAAAAVGGTAALARRVPRLPGFAQASVQAEAQTGLRLATVAEVESVAVVGEGTFTLMARGPGGRAGAGATVIRHQGGNRQVLVNGQRWHVPANKSLKAIPKTDPVGDQLQAAATQAAQRWSPRRLTRNEQNAITAAEARGEPWMARLLERQARGRFVETALRKQFDHLRWSRSKVDVVDPSTGYRYEILSGTESNLALHGQRMTTALFRMITF